MYGKELLMDTKTIDIQELLDLEDIEENELRYSQKYGYLPFNVSTWNPSDYFSHTYLWNHIQLMSFDYIPYLYSYELDQTQLCITKKIWEEIITLVVLSLIQVHQQSH